jgi:lipid-A-disaccharide synthase
MPMRIFLSAGEPSGDLHGGNLIRALRTQRSDLDCVGFGGERMVSAGCRLLYPLSRLALIGFVRVAGFVPTFLELVSRADRYFRHSRPDLVVLIDYPGFNWWLARRAHFHGIPVFYFVPPQLWAWASWRVRRMRKWVDHVLCTLPFEESWYRERGVAAHYIGHPYFDELATQRPDPAFMATQRTRPGPVVALLPGSRTQEVENNLPTLVRTAARVHAERPDARFLVASFKESQHRYADDYLRRHDKLPIETWSGRTPEIIQLARVCVAVSGSVGLELLYHAKPTVVLYRVGRLALEGARRFKNCPYISLVNLLAEKELFPEFLSHRCEAEGISTQVLRWLNDDQAYGETTGELKALRQRVAVPGACANAARYMLEMMSQQAGRRRHAA